MIDFFNNCVFSLIKPVIFAVLTKKGYPQEAKQRKLGLISENGFSKEDKVIMFHGVSVGEIVALENLIKKTREEFVDSKIVVTTGTYTGQDIAKKKFGQIVDLITYFPFDFEKTVSRFLDKINPNIVMIAETELWPCFAKECKKRGIKLFVINGRISDSTYNSYKLIKPLLKQSLNCYSGIFTQSKEDNDKFLSLGADSKITEVMNNLKFDVKKPATNLEFDKNGYKVLLAGSTHQGEDEIVLNIFKKLRDNNKDLKLIIAPRHLTRGSEVENLIKDFGFSYDLRSNNKSDFENIDVLLLNTLGELGKMYAFSDISFIGGSFNKTGGHNPLESLVFGKPVISGSSVHNFKDIYAIIEKAKAGFVVKTADEFYEIANKLLSEPEFYDETIKNCSKVFAEQQGALEFVIKKLHENLD